MSKLLCNHCHKKLPASSFYTDKGSPSGKFYRCKTCSLAYADFPLRLLLGREDDLTFSEAKKIAYVYLNHIKTKENLKTLLVKNKISRNISYVKALIKELRRAHSANKGQTLKEYIASGRPCKQNAYHKQVLVKKR